MYGKEINYRNVIQSLSIETQLQVWSWCLGKYVSLNQFITNSLRVDNNPQCKLREYQGIVFMCDYSFPEYNKYTAIHAVRELLSRNYNRPVGLTEAAQFIAVHLYYGTNPILTSTQVITGKTLKGRPSKSDIYFVPHTDAKGEACFTPLDKQYWQPAEVGVEDLKEMNVFSIKHFYINGKLIRPKLPAYAYLCDDKVKIYCPNESKDFKWFGSMSKTQIWQRGRGKNLLITKSLKDLLVISNQLDLAEWTVISPPNEGILPNVDYELYNPPVILYDWDKAGIKHSEKLAELTNGRCEYFKEEYGKDAYETIINHGVEILRNELQRIKLYE